MWCPPARPAPPRPAPPLPCRYSEKVSFLATFGIAKAFANLAVGLLAELLSIKWTGVLGWFLGLCIPLLAGTSVPPSGPGPGSTRWANMVAASGFLGVQQGLCWSMALLLAFELFGPAQRGLAAGLDESVGYSASAVFAPIYGQLERRFVSCTWLEEEGRGGTRANATGGPLTPECEAASHGVCSSSDSWQAPCVGQCMCTGYMSLLMYMSLTLLLLGLAINVLLLRNPRPATPAAPGDGCYIQLGGATTTSKGGGGGGSSSLPLCTPAADLARTLPTRDPERWGTGAVAATALPESGAWSDTSSDSAALLGSGGVFDDGSTLQRQHKQRRQRDPSASRQQRRHGRRGGGGRGGGGRRPAAGACQPAGCVWGGAAAGQHAGSRV